MQSECCTFDPLGISTKTAVFLESSVVRKTEYGRKRRGSGRSPGVLPVPRSRQEPTPTPWFAYIAHSLDLWFPFEPLGIPVDLESLFATRVWNDMH